MDLGANEWTTFWKVTFPLILPGIIAAALLAFCLSIDDFVITNFMSGTTDTFPIWIYARTKQRHAGAGQRDRHDHLPHRRRLRAVTTLIRPHRDRAPDAPRSARKGCRP